MIGVIGCGTMAQAIVKGFYQKNNQVDFLTYTPSYTRAEELAKAVNGKTAKNLSEFEAVDTIVIACKPQQLGALAEDLENLNINFKNKHIISILAATPIAMIQKKLNVAKVTRVMPNTPALIGMGMSLIIHGEGLVENEKNLVQEFFSSCGEVAEMPNEILFDQVTTVSGSGPAYVFLFAQTMADKLAKWGVDSEQAKKIAIQLFKGSSELMLEQKDLSFEKLIANVTSKGGVTIEAVKSFQENEINTLTSKALDAAYRRSIEIEEELKKS